MTKLALGVRQIALDGRDALDDSLPQIGPGQVLDVDRTDDYLLHLIVTGSFRRIRRCIFDDLGVL